MKPNKVSKRKRALRNICESYLGKPTPYGHFKIDHENGREYRVKFQKTSWRYEVKIGQGAYRRWKKLDGGYYSQTDDVDFELKVKTWLM